MKYVYTDMLVTFHYHANVSAQWIFFHETIKRTGGDINPPPLFVVLSKKLLCRFCYFGDNLEKVVNNTKISFREDRRIRIFVDRYDIL